jgi:hypothetical protein
MPLFTSEVTPTVVTFENSLGGRTEIKCDQVECQKEQDVPVWKRSLVVMTNVSEARCVRGQHWKNSNRLLMKKINEMEALNKKRLQRECEKRRELPMIGGDSMIEGEREMETKKVRDAITGDGRIKCDGKN